MRRLYRETRTVAGNYMDVDIFPVFKNPKKRGVKAKPTCEAQAMLNQRRSEDLLTQLVNENFTNRDIWITLTYTEDTVPAEPKDVLRDAQNYVRRLKRLYRRLGIKDVKYIIVPEETSRFHVHIFVTGCENRDDIEALWKYGYANARRIRFNEHGATALAHYSTKERKNGKSVFSRRWYASRNIVRPVPIPRDARISAKKAEELATVSAEDKREWRKLYPDYVLVESESFFNELNGGWYVRAKFYKKGTVFDFEPRKEYKRKEHNHVEKA